MPAEPAFAPTRGLKIALVSDWFAPRRGGIESHLSGLGRALTAAGAQVSVLTPQPGARSNEVAVFSPGGLRLPGFDLAVSPRLVRRMATALTVIAPDVVHVHASIVAPACLAGLIAARRLGLPVVLTAHSDLAVMAPLLRWLGPRWPDVRLTAVSSRIAAQLAPLSSIAPQVLANGFDAGFWMADPAQPPAGGAFRLVSAMRLERKKRPQVLGRLREALERRINRPVEMVVAGEGRHHDTLGPGVQSPGWLGREGLRALYRSAHAFVLPSQNESFGIAALEARAAGLPVIGRADTGLAEFIRDGEDGFLCDSDAAMLEALQALAMDPELAYRLAGPRPALGRFDWPVIAAQHLALYRQVASGG